MSMLDSFFSKGFKGPKCKTLLKLTMSRIKLLRNRREMQLKQMRRDIAKLLETGQEATARIRVEHIVREENMMAAQEILELFCELISVRIPIIETQRECPLDLKEAISSVCFAAPRCADLPELMHVQMLFASKYGKEFVAAATELRPDCGVNRQLIELLSVRPPAPEKKLKLLTDIAEEHGLDWDPTSSETEIFKLPEDLLNGPSQFTSGSVQPLPKEKHEITMESFPSHYLNEQSAADSDSDGLDFPEVPKVAVQPKVNEPVIPSSIPPVSETDDKSSEEEDNEGTQHQPQTYPKQRENTGRETGNKTYEFFDEDETFHSEKSQSSQAYPKQKETTERETGNKTLESFDEDETFQSDKSQSSQSYSKQNETTERDTGNKTFEYFDEDKTVNSRKSQSYMPPVLSTSSFPLNSKHGSDANVDLQDVLAAAQAAADSAERAASAARSAASLAQLRITELVRKRNEETFQSGLSFYPRDEVAHEPNITGKTTIDHQHSFGGSSVSDSPVANKHLWEHPKMDSDSPPHHVSESKFDSYGSFGNSFQPDLAREQPHRATSMDDDPYFSYPNLFSSKPDNDEIGDHSTDTKSGHL